MIPVTSLNVLELNESYVGVAAPHPWPTRIRVSTRRKSTWLTFAPLDVLKGYASNVSKPLPKSPVRTNEYSENPRGGGNKMNESEFLPQRRVAWVTQSGSHSAATNISYPCAGK